MGFVAQATGGVRMNGQNGGIQAWSFTLVAVFALGLALRLYSLRAGLPAINDPDELTFQLGAMKMLRNHLDPAWFGHPALTTMYGLALTDILVFVAGLASGRFTDLKSFVDAIYSDPGVVILPGRLLMVAASLGCVWLVFRFSNRQWGHGAGLVSAGLIAVSPTFIVWSQVIRSDIIGCFFMLLALGTGQRMLESGFRRRDIVWAALWTAAAVASKWPFAITTLGIAGAIVLAARNEGATWRTIVARLAGYGALCFAWLVAISPYLLINFGFVVRNVAGESQQRHLGAAGGPPFWDAYWYASGPILGGLGWLGAGLAVLGLIRLCSDRSVAVTVGLPIAGFALLLVAQNVVFERWALPLIVLLAFPTGAAIAELLVRLPDVRRYRLTMALAFIALLAQPAWQSVQQDRARNNDTRQRAAAWARAHFQPRSKVLVEHFAFDLLPQPWTFYFPLGDTGCVNANDWLHGKVDYEKVQNRRGPRTNVDYGTLAPAREDTCRTDYAILTQYDRYLAEQAAFPAEVATYQRLIGRGQTLAIFSPIQGQSSGPVVRIIGFNPTAPTPTIVVANSPSAKGR